MHLLISFLIGLVVLSAVRPGPALAQTNEAATPAATPEASAGEFTIAPVPQDDPAITERGYFILEVGDGESANGGVQVRNTGIMPIVVELSVADGVTAQMGGSAFAPTEAAPKAAGRWLRLDEDQISLDPAEQASVGFTVEVPADTPPGQYLAGIVAYIPATSGTPVTASGDQAGAAIIMQTRYVIPVQVNVPGAWTPSLTITGAHALEYPTGTRLGIEIRNDGDTFLQPEGEVTLSNAADTPITTEPIQLDTVITGTSITYPIPWPGSPDPGDYGVDVELRYGDGLIARYSGTVAVSENAPAAPAAPDEAEEAAPAAPAPVPAPSLIQPWMIYALGALLVLIVILLALILIRGNRRSNW